MAAPLDLHRWVADPEQFAATVRVDDVPGFFSRKLIIEPGTLALIIDQGQCLGEVGPGTYTLETFDERLQFWLRKQATAIVTRQEDLTLELTCENVPTSEHLAVGVTVRIAVEIDDLALFWQNLMGTRNAYSVTELRDVLSPLVRQALWECVGRRSITELTAPGVRGDLDAAVAKTLDLTMKRYGMKFAMVQLVSIRHEKFDEHRRKLGETWLLKQGLEQQQALNELYSEEELLKIKKLEQDNELAVLAENVAVDRMEAEVTLKTRRIQARNRLRDAVLSEEFDKIETEEEFARFVEQRDKDRLIRDEEMDELKEGFRTRQEDRTAARSHLTAKLDLERKLEIDSVRQALDFTVKSQKLQHELELARQVRTADNEQWAATLQRESDEAKHRRQEQDRQFAQQREWAKREAAARREDQWDDLLQAQKADRLKGEVEIARQERINRVQRLEAELQQSLETSRLETDRRRKQWELEVAQQESQNQLDRLAAVQKLNHEAAQREFDLHERRQRLDVELQDLRDDKDHNRELARIEATKNLGVEAMIATANTANAALLADLKKHEATQHAAVAQAEIARDGRLDEERRQMYERLSETEKAKADAVAAAFREAMQSQQANVQQMIASLGDVGQQQARSQQTTVVVPGIVPAPTVVNSTVAAGRILICSSCRAENSETAKFCSGCGARMA